MTLELRKDTFISFEILKERNQCYVLQKQTVTRISHKTQLLGAGEQGRAIIMGVPCPHPVKRSINVKEIKVILPVLNRVIAWLAYT